MAYKKREQFTVVQVTDAIKQAKGYVSKAADILGCGPKTVYNYAERYPTVKEAIDAVREERHDFVESALMQRIKAQDTTAIIFYLKTQAKQRGYVERQEISGTDGAPLQGTSVTVYMPENGRE